MACKIYLKYKKNQNIYYATIFIIFILVYLFYLKIKKYVYLFKKKKNNKTIIADTS